MAKFDAAGFLKSQGLSISDASDDGNYIVNTPDGQQVKMDVKGFLKSEGVPVDKLDIEYNTPDTAFDSSPVSGWDRAKLALGNTKGQLNYLKSKFEDAVYTPDKGLVVKDRGVYKKVDSSSMDPWELSKDVVEGAISMSPSLLGGGLGSTVGAAVGSLAGPAGTVAGSVVGSGVGAGIAEKIRGTLGRAVGTYDATPEEELKDIGWETLFNMGGQGLALGAKPLLSSVIKAGKNIGKSAAGASQDILADVIGRTTGAGSKAVGTLFEASDDVGRQIMKAKTRYGAESAAVEGLQRENIKLVEKLVEDAPEALSRKYSTLINELGASAPEKFSVNVGGLIKKAQQKLADKGLGEFGESGAFEVLSNKKAIQRIVKGESGSLLDDETAASVSKMFGILNDLSKAGSAEGKTAVKSLMELNRTMNQTARNLTSGNVPPIVKKFVDDIRSAVSDEVGSHFAAHGMGEKFLATGQLYERFADSVNYARKVMNSDTGAETLLNRINSGIGRNSTYKDLAGDMAELLGDRGKNMLRLIQVKDAASKFVPTLPKMTLGSFSTGGLAAAGALSGVVSGPMAAGAAALASPRAVAAGTRALSAGSKKAAQAFQYTKKVADFARNLSPKALNEFLQNPEAVNTTVRTALDAYMREDSEAENLLRQTGVK